MVAAAQLAIEAGWEVRGSDTELYPPTSHMVEALKVPVASKYAAENLDWHPDVVVVGNALSRGNAEVEAVLTRRLHYVSLAEWLKDAVLRTRRPVAVCGTHGKTTTTALLAHVLCEAGLDPGYLIGGQPLNFTRSAKLGAEGAPFVIEGDEYDSAFFDKRAKFFHYLPEIAVVTSLEFDHGDIYRDLDEITLAFQRMLRQIPEKGYLILCGEDKNALRLREHAPCRVRTYGFGANADYRGVVLGASDGSQYLSVYKRRRRRLNEAAGIKREPLLLTELRVPMAGKHNLLNTLAAVAVADRLGVSGEMIGQAIEGFKGVRRRMEVFLRAKGITFVDDFAHHPTAIRETIAAARGRWPGSRLRVLFEPRSNTTVTRVFQKEMAAAFAEAHEVWIGPIFRPERIKPGELLDRKYVIQRLAAQGVNAHCTDDVEEIVNNIQGSAQAGDVVLILSNGAFGGIYESFRKIFDLQ